MPKRIQRKRTKGWRMPENAVYVGRPTKWGNPYMVIKKRFYPRFRVAMLLTGKACYSKAEAVECYRNWLSDKLIEDAKRELRGKDLCCWCSGGCECHADVLLEIANS